MTKHRSAPIHGLKNLALTDGAGTYEAVVSVFGVVDYAGDRVLVGAFANSLERWKASGDPIPVVFAHQWDDLDAHVGEVLEAKELAPGDDQLPEELAANGGLWVKFRLDVTEDFAGRLAKRLDRRTIREFSFAYDVITERRASDGANDLVELDVIEVGPCLKGMNPATVLMAKALGSGGAAVVASLRSMGEGDLADQLAKALDAPGPDGTKSVEPTFAGSAEELQGKLLDALYGWATEEGLGRGGLYAVHLEATYGDRAITTVEGWDDPIGLGTTYEVAYTWSDGTVEIGEATEVVIEAAVEPKTRAARRRSALVPEASGIVREPTKGRARGKADEDEDPTHEDPEDGDRGGDPALVHLELEELDTL